MASEVALGKVLRTRSVRTWAVPKPGGAVVSLAPKTCISGHSPSSVGRGRGGRLPEASSAAARRHQQSDDSTGRDVFMFGCVVGTGLALRKVPETYSSEVWSKENRRILAAYKGQDSPVKPSHLFRACSCQGFAGFGPPNDQRQVPNSTRASRFVRYGVRFANHDARSSIISENFRVQGLSKGGVGAGFAAAGCGCKFARAAADGTVVIQILPDSHRFALGSAPWASCFADAHEDAGQCVETKHFV